MKKKISYVLLGIFVVMSMYIVFIETERYESECIVQLKDLSEKQEISLDSILLNRSAGTMQDSKILELYIRSFEMFEYVDKKHKLRRYYTGDELDLFRRLYKDAILPFYQVNNKNLLEKFNDDLFVIYDEPSGTLSLSYAHANPKKARKILQSIIARADYIVNKFEQESSQVALRFIEKQKVNNKKLFIDSIKKLIKYQNSSNTVDPAKDVERKYTILANLEGDLIENEVSYNSKLKENNPNSPEMKTLKEIIRNLRGSIARVKAEMTSKNPEKMRLNTSVFDFELLKSDMEFNKEVFRQTLINQEKLRMEVSQNTRHLITVTKPSLPDDYSYPEKLWDIVILLIVLFFLYSIVTTVVVIIRDHVD